MYNSCCNEKSFTEVNVVPKDLNVVLLLDYYGGLLPEKQRRITEYYYCDDLSLAEISENEGITRQGARDAIVRAVKKLNEYESTVGFAEKISTVKRVFEKYKSTEALEDLDKLSKSIEEM